MPSICTRITRGSSRNPARTPHPPTNAQPGDFKFDPLGFAKDEQSLKKLQLNEVKNGRLAMVRTHVLLEWTRLMMYTHTHTHTMRSTQTKRPLLLTASFHSPSTHALSLPINPPPQLAFSGIVTQAALTGHSFPYM